MPRKPGQRTGRDEGLVINVVRKHTGPKSRAYSRGATQKFGFAGGIGAPSPVRVSGQPTWSGSTQTTNPKPAAPFPAHPEHWHRDEDGTITKGEAPVEEEVEHIHRLSHEHVKRGHIVAFEIPHFGVKGEGEVTAYGPRGVTIRDGEGGMRRLFYHELNEVRPPEPPEKKKPKKKEPVVTGTNIRSVLHGIRKWWQKEREKKK